MYNKTKKTTKLGLILILFSIFSFQYTRSRTINLLLKSAPKIVLDSIEKEFLGSEKISQIEEKISQKGPSKMVKNIAKSRLAGWPLKVCGFPAVYGGYFDYSSDDGVITFPLMHVSKKLRLVVAKEIGFERLFANTISHQQIVENGKAKIYLFEQKEDEEKERFWDVSEEKVESSRIKAASVVILTSPKNIFIPTGKFMIDHESANLVMPKIYVVGNLNLEQSILNSLDMKLYFEQVDIEEKKIKDKKIIQKMISNQP
jgi:hypothetical protein